MRIENFKLGDAVIWTYRLLASAYGIIISKPCLVKVFGDDFNILWVFLFLYLIVQFVIALCFKNRNVKSIVGQLVDLAVIYGWIHVNQSLNFYTISFIILLLISEDNSSRLSLRLLMFIGLPLMLYVSNHEHSFKIAWPFVFFLLYAYMNSMVR